MKKKVLITQPWPTWYVSELDQLIQQLEEKGCEVILDPKTTDLTEEEVIQRVPGLYAHICGTDAWGANSIDHADKIKVISRIGIGYDSVDVKYATQKGIAVTVCPGAGAESVAEQAFAMMLAVGRQLVQGDQVVRAGRWDKVIGPSLYRKTLGIIGLGNIGKQLVKIVSGFEMKIIAADDFQDANFASTYNVEYVPMDELLTRSDFVSIHAPKNANTLHMIGARELGLMKERAVLINCARGGLVDEAALYAALKTKQIFGAATDVLVTEPVQANDPLLTLENMIFMPHNAGTSFEGKNTVVGMAVQNVIDIIDGKKPAGLLNPEVF